MRRALLPLQHAPSPNLLQRILDFVFHHRYTKKLSHRPLDVILMQARQSVNPYGTEFQTSEERHAYESLVRMTAHDWIDRLYLDEPEMAQKLDLELRNRKKL